MMKKFMHRWAFQTRASQAGGIAFTLFASVALLGVLGAGAITVMKGPVSSMSKVTKRAVAENSLMAGGKLSVAAAMAQGDGGDCDADNMVEPLEWSASGTGTAPSGGGFIPSSISITRADPWGTTYGYCVWDHGSDIKNGDCATTNRLSGQADANGPLIAIMSAGPDRQFQTTCGNAPTYVTRAAGSDDSVLTYTFSEIQSQMGGIWNLKSGDAATAEISKTLEVKDSGGDVNFALNMASGLGDFIGLMVGTIKGKLTAPVAMEAGLKIDNDTNVTSCEAGEEGSLRYHATNGVEVCDGSDYVPAGSAASGGGFNYSGLYEGKISAGINHTCAVRADSTGYCWGINAYGQLGDATTVNKSTSTLVVGGHKFVTISAGGYFSCGLRTDGAIYCWGRNDFGQLGRGTTVTDSTPVVVSGGHKFVSVSAGLYHTCGLRTDGAAYCWGANSVGALGDGTTTVRTVPRLVTGGHKFVQVSVGNDGTCGLRADGAAYCWGWNTYGGVGDGTTTNRAAPTAVSGNHKFVQVSAGSAYNCGLRTDGAIYCWGVNDRGQQGNGTTTDSTQPVAVSGGHVFKTISSGTEHICGIRTDGVSMCWGLNDEGHIGDATIVNKTVPTAVLGGADMAIISAGGNHTCGIKANGAAYCWGYNASGQVGDGTTTRKLIPTSIMGFSMLDYQKVPYQFGEDGVACAAGIAGTVKYTTANGLEVCNGTSYVPAVVPSGATSQYRYNGLYEGKLAVLIDKACAVRLDGQAYCWGDNYGGQLGDGTTTGRSVPNKVLGNHKFVQIVGQDYRYICGLRSNGDAYCWGDNESGQFGNGTTTGSTTPTIVTGGHKFVQLTAGTQFTCGLRTDGAAYCWGDNADGKLGRGNTTASTTPVLVTGGHKFVMISAGHQHTCGLRNDAAVYCWGANWGGQLGDGTTTTRTSPTAVTGGHTFGYLSAGGHNTCAIGHDGETYCWGMNDYGQLGDGTTTDRSSPTMMPGGYNFTVISTNYEKTCAIATTGQAYCWGMNDFGQLGNGTTTNSVTPVPVAGGGNFIQILTSIYNSCGVRSDGAVYCWGANDVGQLGNGTTTNSLIPVHTGLSLYDLQGASFQFGNDATACSASNAGALRYEGGATWQYCNGTAWGAF